MTRLPMGYQQHAGQQSVGLAWVDKFTILGRSKKFQFEKNRQIHLNRVHEANLDEADFGQQSARCNINREQCVR